MRAEKCVAEFAGSLAEVANRLSNQNRSSPAYYQNVGDVAEGFLRYPFVMRLSSLDALLNSRPR
jgi:hypothetical protein